MPIKVSVVVAVFNPGELIDGLVRSLLDQTMSSAELEVVFVDDGSTDGTRERLEQIADDHPNLRVTAIPNSGWPGRPRNVGTDLAQGEYVFYSDHDDAFFPEAIERMYDLATANRSDIVFGKVVRVGRRGDPPAKRTAAIADPYADNLLHSRTAHKMFRRAFLVEHNIRFLEGRVRLEDHHFMAQAMPHADVVSVLADYPCYCWIHRNDGTNASSSSDPAVSPARYWEFYAGAVRTFARHAGEGALLEEARAVAVAQSFSRYSPTRWHDWSAERRTADFEGVRAFLDAEVPPRVDARLPVLKRMRVAAIRDGDIDRFDRLQRLRSGLTFAVDLESAAWSAGVLALTVSARLTTRPSAAADDASSTELDDRVRPGTEPGELLLCAGEDWGIPVKERILNDTDIGEIELTVRNRETQVEWPVEGTTTTARVATGGTFRLAARVSAQLDPERGAFGAPLDIGIWDVLARVKFLGEGSLVALSPEPDFRATVMTGGRQARAYVTTGGKLAVKISAPSPPRPRHDAQVNHVRWGAAGLQLTLADPASRAAVVLRGDRLDEPFGPFPVHGRDVTIDLSATVSGQSLDAYLRVESAAGVLDRLLGWHAGKASIASPYAVHRGHHGGLTVRHLLPGEPGPENAPEPAGPRLVKPWLTGGQGQLLRVERGVRRVLRRAVRRGR